MINQWGFISNNFYDKRNIVSFTFTGSKKNLNNKFDSISREDTLNIFYKTNISNTM